MSRNTAFAVIVVAAAALFAWLAHVDARIERLRAESRYLDGLIDGLEVRIREKTNTSTPGTTTPERLRGIDGRVYEINK